MEEAFGTIRSQINFYTAVDDNRLKFLYHQVKATQHLSGPMAEVGVFQGGSLRLLALSDTSRLVFGIDTFEGLPAPTDKDVGTIHHKGDFDNTSLAVVKASTEDLKNVILVQDTFPNRADEIFGDGLFSLAHIDLDLYQSTLDCLEFFYPRMVPGGIIVVDDYRWKDTPGVTRAVDEFFSTRDATVEMNPIGCSCRIIKL